MFSFAFLMYTTNKCGELMKSVRASLLVATGFPLPMHMFVCVNAVLSGIKIMEDIQ